VLLVILALFWVVLLTPIVVRRFRDNGAEKSIQSFHQEHELLSRQEYVYEPAHRLDDPDDVEYFEPTPKRRPRLTVVHPDDTYQSLETRGSWDEWSEDYDYDQYEERERRHAPMNRYAAAYSSTPTAAPRDDLYEPPIRRRTMKAQRRMIVTRLGLSVAIASTLAFATGYSMLVDVAILTWIAVALYVSMALYAVSQGYLFESSVGIPAGRRQDVATVEPMYGDYVGYEDDAASEFYDSQSDGRWGRESSSRYAVG